MAHHPTEQRLSPGAISTGTALGFDDLARQAGRMGFKETHLRAVLTDLAQDGLAVREEPLDYTKTPWPAGSTIRFYPSPS